MATNDREKQFERALARHCSNASPDSACPDAEILAAYHERTLSLEEMAHWKGHITSCACCQEALALVEQTETVPAEDWKREEVADLLPAGKFWPPMAAVGPRASASFEELPSAAASIAIAGALKIKSARRLPPWRWIAPLGAIAAAVVVCIGVWEIRMQRLEQGHVTEIAANGPREAPPDQNSELAMHAQPATIPPPETKRELPVQGTASPPKPRVVPSTEPKNSIAADRYSALEKDLAEEKYGTALSSKAAGGAMAIRNSPAAAKTATINRSLDAAKSATPAPALSAIAAGKATEAPKEEFKKTPSTNDSIIVEQAPRSSVPLDSAELKTSDNLNALSMKQLAQLDRRYILSPGDKLAWRLGGSGKIERSSDHGKSWKLQNSGVTADLTAGSASSDKICWVIGKAGTLLLTTDGGKHWKTINSPITDDLGGIHATDASRASIWDVPNRRSYETSDAGATWIRVANE